MRSCKMTSVSNIERIPIAKLLLDDENPRLSSGDGGVKQEELLYTLWTEMAVDEVALSIAANGYFEEEPLFVIPDKKNKDKYIVVEGNRRLAAVLLLVNDKLREKIKATNLPLISESAKKKLEELPVSKYPDRKSLWTFCGFRHINGPKAWDAFSKAKYIAEVHEEFGVSLEDIANKIGDKHSTVKRLYRGYKILQQAEDQTSFERGDRVRNRFYFSHLYTAVDQKEFQEFLGIDPGKSLRSNPVHKKNLSALNELMVWLYGKKSENIEPVVRTQNPDLGQLREVLGKESSLSALRTTRSLEKAYEVGIGDKRRFRDAITRAKIELYQAKGAVTAGYAGEDDMYELIGTIIEMSEIIKEEMESKREKRKPVLEKGKR